MDDKIETTEVRQEITKQEKVLSLFKFIEELNKLKQKVVLRVSDYPWFRPISSLPDDPENIKVYYRDRVEEEDTEDTTDVLLAVHKPEFQSCPTPDPNLENWLEQGWNDYHYKAKVKNFILLPLDQVRLPEEISEADKERIDEENHTYREFFSDSEERIAAFHTWTAKRDLWAEKQKMLEKTRDFFSELYKISVDLERESETLELVVADGFLRDRDLPELDHPILTRRVKIRHDAAENTIYIEDTNVETELYTVMFQSMDGINLSSINHMRDDLHQNDYHPLDRNDLPAFLKIFVHQLSSESIYVEDGIPDSWQKKERLLLYRNPCYILRKRMDGALKAIEQIIEHVEKTGEVPAPIGDIVEGGKIDIPEDTGEVSIEEQLAAVGGESVDILLSKEANKEQLEIARRIERYNAVLVQGPPGTGKTHTIANLMGHFLAQGKSVLVTSHTQKALIVLKDKVAPGLQSLCVSMLDDSNVDMEKSIDGITSYMSQYTSFELKKEMESLGLERKQIIRDLAKTRKKLFSIINQECNCIVFNGEELSPSMAAEFVRENSETLSYIPGMVRLYEPLPLTFAELSELYRSNSSITAEDESEFNHDLPNPEDVMTPKDFEDKCNALNSAMAHLDTISENEGWKIQNLPVENKISITAPFGQLTLDYPESIAVNQLRDYVSAFPKVEPWMQHCAVDGKKGETYKQLWTQLIQQLQDTSVYAERLTAEKFGKDVQIFNPDPDFADAMKQLLEKYKQGGKIGKLTLLFNKQLEMALNGATVNGRQPQTIADTQKELEKNRNVLQIGKRIYSNVCKVLHLAAEAYDPHAYRTAFAILEETYAKTSLKAKRENYLNRLAPVAPQWADAIRTRSGIHGEAAVPSDIDDAWKWKQYYGIIEEIIAEPFPELQKRSLALSKEYRRITAKYAEKAAWYNLLRTTEHDISMKQALIGWKQTVKKIGKGTGKNAPMYRAKARELMVKCQSAVPGWIMPIGKALESLNPGTNKFDIIIIDEASQSDISSLAILYMGKKLVIVGDDKQVSPMAVGVQVDKMNALKEMYIAGKIPNDHLYDAKTSIYDIAATTFQPLMLHEHFRCVPEIIGFSNWLSYDFKIKPLRDCSNNVLLPAVVNYRVANGERIGKTNPNEAKAVVALMQACMEQPEYAGKTFGIISLLGDEQVKKLQEEIYSHIDPKDVSERRILCGNASNFQGDERDVIFLSVVDCANGTGPVAKQAFGVDDAYRKRYNVAASRARDQLWVVDSLDSANDLKPGDIRKMLIDYSLNPESVAISNAKIEQKAESPFESAVARFLTVRGYHLVQQWKVGAYRLDMVAVCGRKKVAIECDGERWHSGEDKIREDMERQTILERLGWQFIRIRGSEYYRDPNKTMERVVSELNDNGIEPEASSAVQDTKIRETELLQRVKQRAFAIIHQDDGETSELDESVIEAALDPKNDVIGTSIEKVNDLAVPEEKEQVTGIKDMDTVQSPAESEIFPVSAPVVLPETAIKLVRDQRLKTAQQNPAPEKMPPLKTQDYKPEQMMLFGMEDQKSDADDIIGLLEATGVEFVDKRANGGSLWIIGGYELAETVRKAKALGCIFHFKKEGGRATKNKPGWWAK